MLELYMQIQLNQDLGPQSRGKEVEAVSISYLGWAQKGGSFVHRLPVHLFY